MAALRQVLEYQVESLEARRLLTFIVPGGSFETPDDLANWYTFNGASAALNILPDAPQGSGAVLVGAQPGVPGALGTNLTPFVTDGALQRGADYRISAAVKLASPVSSEVTLNVRYEDGSLASFPIVDRADVGQDAWVTLQGGFRLGEYDDLSGLHIQLYAEPGVDFYVDDVQMEVYDWRAVVDQRIETYRRRDATLSFVDEAGAAVEVASVELKQTQSEFGFGTAVHTGNLDNETYTNFVAEHFNWVTPENAWKWPFTERTEGQEEYGIIEMAPQVLSADGLAEFAEDNGLQVRGHNVLWSHPFGTPGWVDNIDTAVASGQQQLLATINARIDSLVTRYAGVADHWDVINELLVDESLQAQLDAVSDSGNIVRDVFERVRQHDPDAVLFTNEFNILNRFEQASVYRTMLDELVADGVPVGGVGIQGHFNEYVPISSFALETELAHFDGLGLPVWITEFSNRRTQVEERAADLEVFLRTTFADADIDGVTLWGFWEGADGPGTPFERGGVSAGVDGALIDSDWTVNAAGQVLQSLRDEWTTELSSAVPTDSVSFRGFHGEYEVVVTLADGRQFKDSVTLDSSSTALAALTVSIPTTELKTTTLVSAARPLQIDTLAGNYDVIPIFGSTLDFEGETVINASLSTSDIGGLTVRADESANEVSLFRFDDVWQLQIGVDGEFTTLATLPHVELGGDFQLRVSDLADRVELVDFDGNEHAFQLTESLFEFGDQLRMYTFSGPSSTVAVDLLSITHAQTESQITSQPALKELAASQGVLWGALPDSWVGNSAMDDLYLHHTGMLTLPLDYPSDVADPAQSFQDRESLLSFAAANDMPIRGHSLVWHLTAPASHATLTRPELIEAMKSRIQNTIQAFPTVQEWVVVNEPLNYDGTLRDSVYRTGIGDEYIKLAFEFAREVAGPQVKLLINEYQVEVPGEAKSDAYLQLVSDLIAQGTPIDGIGIQGHLALGGATIPTYAETRANLERFAALGLDLHITELDASTEFLSGTPAEISALQTSAYSDFISACLDTGVCRSITTWAYVDGYSWLNTPSMNPDMDDAPLLFLDDLTPKPTFNIVSDLLGSSRLFVDQTMVGVSEGEVAVNAGRVTNAASLSASIGNVILEADGTWTWEAAALGASAVSQTVTLTAIESDGDAVQQSFELMVTNLPPTLSAASASVTVAEGSLATQHGFYADPGDDAVSFSASIGQVSESEPGIWTWTLPTTDGPIQSQPVLITATDSDQAFQTVAFELVVENVAPLLAVDAPSVNVDEGALATQTGTITDPGDDAVSLSASIGQVVQANGTWSWSLPGVLTSQVVTITGDDGEGGTSQVVFEVLVGNLPPVANEDDLGSFVEGSTNDATAEAGLLANDSDPSGSLTVVAVNGVGTAVGQPVLLNDTAQVTVDSDGSWQLEVLSGISAGVYELSFTYVVADDAGAQTTGVVRFEVIGQNVAPEIEVAGSTAEKAVGQSQSFVANVTDGDRDDTVIGNWELSAPDGIITSMVGETIDAAFSQLGTYQLKFTADDGLTTSTWERSIDVLPVVSDEGDLVIGGTDGNDRIFILPRRGIDPEGTVRVLLNGRILGTFGVEGKIVIRGLGGNDLIRVSRSIRVTQQSELYGGEGNDRLFSGRENTLLDGGKGDDRLYGFLGDDTLLGGDGFDLLIGSLGNDFLDGGQDAVGDDQFLDRLIGGPGNDTFVLRLLDRNIGFLDRDDELVVPS